MPIGSMVPDIKRAWTIILWTVGGAVVVIGGIVAAVAYS